MIGIGGVGSYIPQHCVDTLQLVDRFSVSAQFLEQKTGFISLARRCDDESLATMCHSAFLRYQQDKCTPLDAKQVRLICVCSQNPDQKLPHTSAILQEMIGAAEDCLCFDVSLGCSGYPYGVAICTSLMEKLGLEHGLLFTCDPYSRYLDEKDKNTQLLFGDAATVTHFTNECRYVPDKYFFQTFGNDADKLYSDDKGIIHMDGRAIFNFSMRSVVGHIQKQILDNGACDIYLLHQASRFVVESVRQKLNLSSEMVPFGAKNYGNTISSSIPLLLGEIWEKNLEKIFLCGFGVGLSISSLILRRT